MRQAPRAGSDLKAWAGRLVAWLDEQRDQRILLSPIVEKTINGAALLLNTNIVFTHSLEQRVLSATEPNVKWVLCGWKHSGAGSGVGTAVSVGYCGGVVASNTIELKVFANTLTVNAGNPLTVWVWFQPEVEKLDQL